MHASCAQARFDPDTYFNNVIEMAEDGSQAMFYGTKIGLVPLHNWLPDAHSEGPTPMSAVLSGLLLNDALPFYCVHRQSTGST